MTKTQVSGFSTVVLLLLMILFSYPAPMFAADDFDSLRAEIAAANRSSGAITLSGDIVLSAALPQITGRVTIEGAGHTISGAGEYRIFDVAGGRLALSNVTLTEGNVSEGHGGAIRMRNGAQVTIENSTLSANSARHGGAIATSGSSDRLNISESNFSGNIAEQSAGAIYARGGIVNITGGSFVKNCAQFAFFTGHRDKNSVQRSVDDDGCHRVTYFGSEITAEVQSLVDGGAIRLRHGARVSVEGSSFSENSATYGGAISSASKNIRLTVNNSSFVGNRASWSGGAIGDIWVGGGSISVNSSSFVKNTSEHGGGAIEAGQGAFDISNSTFSENYSDGGGGAISVGENGAASITHATFVENRSRSSGEAIINTGGELYLRNSIIVTSGSDDNCVGVWEHVGNLSTDGSCADRPSDDPRLGELTGSPAYYPLRDRSPAIDYAHPKYCLEKDQLGRPRPQGGGCDIGAIEARGAIAAEPTPVPPLVCSLAYEIVAANRDQPASGCPAGSGVDTIVLDKDITLLEPLPSIASQIVIEGNGHSISGDGKFRIFDVDGGILTVKNLTMRDGYRQFDNGGAIRLHNDGRATVSDSRFINNSASYGGAVFIGWVGTDRSSLTVNNSSFVGNRSSGNGGAIYAGAGSVTISSSSFVENSAARSFSASTIGVINPFTRLDIVNSSFIRNQRSVLLVENGVTATLTHVTIFGDWPAFETDRYEDIGHEAVNLYLRNSIVIGTFDSVICDRLKQNIGNFIGDDACSPRLSGDPMLEEATDSAAYLAPMPGSPAINAADARFCPKTDQLGRARSIVGRCDIGAIEAVPVSTSVSDCKVTTTHTLNFREQPGGTRFGTVPENSTLTASARTAGWFQVEYRGRTGWISADYVVTEGECGYGR